MEDEYKFINGRKSIKPALSAGEFIRSTPHYTDENDQIKYLQKLQKAGYHLIDGRWKK